MNDPIVTKEDYQVQADEYTARYYCANCGKRFVVVFKKGNYAPDKLDAKCWACELHQLVKVAIP